MIPTGAYFDSTHSYNALHMIPKQKLTFAPPTPKYVMEELKGATGELDYTETLTGKVHYQNRKGEFHFIVLHNEEDDYQAAYTAIRTFFAGQKREVRLDEDEDMHYTGRFTLTEWKSYEGYSEATIAYNVEPFRYSSDNIRIHDWLWDDLDFGSYNEVLYGMFVVNGTKARSLWNTSDYPITPGFQCSAPMTVVVNGNTYQLPQGNCYSPGFDLMPGDNLMTFTGVGTVYIDYPMGVVF